MDRRGLVVEYLDGDTVRTHLSKGLGFSKEDRDANVERHRLGRLAHHAPRRRRDRRGDLAVRSETRAKARALVEEYGPFIEVHVRTSLDECARRDVNGLYAKAFAGEIKGFTGVDDPYEAPASAGDRRRHRGARRRRSRRRRSSRKLEELGLVPAKVTA